MCHSICQDGVLGHYLSSSFRSCFSLWPVPHRLGVAVPSACQVPLSCDSSMSVLSGALFPISVGLHFLVVIASWVQVVGLLGFTCDTFVFMFSTIVATPGLYSNGFNFCFGGPIPPSFGAVCPFPFPGPRCMPLVLVRVGS